MSDATNGGAKKSKQESSPLSDIVDFAEFGIRSQMKERPYVTMAAAVGLGYVLGGGLPKFVAKALGVAGLRYAMSKAFKGMFPGD